MNNFKNISVIASESKEGLLQLLNNIRIPFITNFIYYDSGKNEHVAWVKTDRPMTAKELKRLAEKSAKNL